MNTTNAPRSRFRFESFANQQPGCLIFFRLGDVYEMCWEHAQAAHRLTGLPIADRFGVPSVSVDHWKIERVLMRLIVAGQRVAILENCP